MSRQRGYPAPKVSPADLPKLPKGPAPGAPVKRPTTVDVRVTLDELRAYVGNFRAGHNPQCECEWDRGAMWVIEALDTALGYTEMRETP